MNADAEVKGTWDRSRLDQVVTNLLANAIKYTPAGEIVLTLSVVEEAPDYVILRIEVADTGIGLSAYAQSRIFQPFSKVTAASVHEYRDSALGLAICKQLAVMMGGTMGVQSAEGHGSTFWFTARPRTRPRAPASTAF